MSAISLKSITGITSITTPAGVDNQLTLHTNNTTERVKITAEGNVHINNHLAVLGVSTHNDHVQIIDGKRLKVGSADNGDLILLHDGTDSIIDNATGNLFYRSATHKLQALNAEDMIVCNTDGAVELYHNNVKKLETKSTGVLISNQGSNRILDIHHTNGTSAYIAFLDQNTTDNSIVRCGAEANDFKIFAGGSERLRITSAGALKLTGQSTSFETAGLLHHTNNNLYIRGGTTGAILQSVDGNEAWIVQNNYVSASTAGSERLRIDGSGRVLIGHDTPSGDLHGPQTTTGRSPYIQLHGTNAANASAALISWKNQAGSYYAPALFLAHSGSETKGTNGILPAGAEFGSIVFSGDDGTDFVKGAMIKARLDGTPGTDDMPGRLEFHTTSDGAQAPQERVRINSNGMMSIGKTSNAGKAIEIYQASFAALRIQNSSTGTGNNDGILLEASASDCLLYNYESANLKLGTSGTERLVITSGGHVNIGGLYSQTSYGLSVRGGAVDQNVQFSNTKSTNGNIHYIGITLTNGGYGQALFGHTGHTTAGEQAAWMGLAGDDVAGGTGVKCFRGGKVQMGASTTLQAFINNSVSGHQFISQCSDNNNGFEIYQKHGSTATRKTLAVYANTGNSAAKQIQFEVRGDNTTHAYGTKNTTLLTLNTAQSISGAHSYGDENRLDFLMYNEIPQFTGNPAARIAGYLQRGNNGFGLRFYARTNASTLFKAMEITADYEVLPGINGSVDLGSSSYRWKNVYTSDLDLSNEAKGGNDVDGTWGSYTIQEGESDLFLINKRNGKKYKFNLTEVS